MSRQPVALWVIGPLGSGKSFFIAQLADFAVVDQDAELESQMVRDGLPLDTRLYSPEQAGKFAALRMQAAEQTWREVPNHRQRGVNIAFETTGDKPHLLEVEVALNCEAGYQNLGIGLGCSLETCLAQNQHRSRVLPPSAVEASWHTFHGSLAAGIFQRVFGDQRFVCVDQGQSFDAMAWIEAVR